MDKELNKTFSTLSTETLIDALRSFNVWRKSMHDKGLNDNVGAIHSAERIAELLSLKIAYPGLTHLNKLRHYEFAWFSKNAKIAFDKNEKVEIEHVFPKRVYTKKLLCIIGEEATNEDIKKWISENFKLALLTHQERTDLDKINRSEECHGRLESAKIKMCDELPRVREVGCFLGQPHEPRQTPRNISAPASGQPAPDHRAGIFHAV